MRLQRRPSFIDDLTAAYAYLASDSPRTADRFLDEVEQLALLLSDFPKAGRLRRFRYVVFYRIEADALVLLRMLHGARKISRTLVGV